MYTKSEFQAINVAGWDKSENMMSFLGNRANITSHAPISLIISYAKLCVLKEYLTIVDSEQYDLVSVNIFSSVWTW